MRATVAGFSPRTLSALLWGAVGFMAFLVLVQGYALVVDPLVSIVQGVVVAGLVGALTAGSAYVLEYRIATWSTRRAMDETGSHGDDKSKS
ncbi:hypothetical protein [Natronorubrum sulfidifaciens]|uniref:DUF7981 domain-containing protein n=1 Tax=Natronorubrum sulfidifaciens JCM 14089 TaxID=1230460 RepID=L9WDB8_9EURY|nr:hypothetical protein [Natronorubrum sulfidifaciens]ELY47475.1 hypothetical protein C495_04427 [Natronorubrum sulfidifaciens JCM 14089]